MGTHVAEIDVTAPPSIELPAGSSDALLLVRWSSVPVGLAHVAGSGVLSADRIRAAIAAQIALPSSAPTLPPAAPPLTIVVCTRERPADLTRCLTSLKPFALGGHDVIVVDNAPTSQATADVAARYPVRYVREPHVGLNNARNRGLDEARHPIVAYVDDDAVADERWADALAEPFGDPRAGCVTGLVLPLELRTRAQQVFETYAQHRRTFVRHMFTAADTAPAAAGVVGVGANMAVRRDLARQLGGFDPRLDAGTLTCSGGDNDMFARVLDAGHAIVYTPQALVWHRHRDTDADLRNCVFGYGVGVYAFLTKRLIERRDLGALVIGARWLVGPFLRASRRRLSRSSAPPFRLLLLEAAGALLGPVRFFAEHRRSRRRTAAASRV